MSFVKRKRFDVTLKTSRFLPTKGRNFLSYSLLSIVQNLFSFWEVEVAKLEKSFHIVPWHIRTPYHFRAKAPFAELQEVALRKPHTHAHTYIGYTKCGRISEARDSGSSPEISNPLAMTCLHPRDRVKRVLHCTVHCTSRALRPFEDWTGKLRPRARYFERIMICFRSFVKDLDALHI